MCKSHFMNILHIIIKCKRTPALVSVLYVKVFISFVCAVHNNVANTHLLMENIA